MYIHYHSFSFFLLTISLDILTILRMFIVIIFFFILRQNGQYILPGEILFHKLIL